MPSLVTSVIGGIQGARASHHAAEKLQKGYGQAGETISQAVEQVNPEILQTAAQAGQDVTEAATTAGTGATTAAEKLLNLLSPYMEAGATAAGQLPEAAKPFTASMMAQYSPAYQFQLQQGQQAANRAAAASGLTGAGGTLKSLQRYTQDYAGTAFERASNLYNQNFNRLATLANMGVGATTTAGEAGMRAAEYAGTLGTGAAQWTGAQNINARNAVAQNTLSGANYLANTQVEAQKALAQGDLGAAQSWNQMLGGIGAAGNTVLFGGLSPTGGGWSFKNIGKNLWGTGA